MPNLYINNVLIYPKSIKELNNIALTAQYDFAQQNEADEHITFKIPDEDPAVIAQIYLINRATVTTASCNIMIQLLIHYPMYTHIDTRGTFYMTSTQLQEYMKYMTPDSVAAHYDTIVASIKKVDQIAHIIEHTDDNAKICCSSKFHPFIKYIREMYSHDVDDYIEIPEGSYIRDACSVELVLGSHPFGYHDGLQTISSEDEFKTVIKTKQDNLYINCNIGYTAMIDNVPIDKIPPEVFATWVIGPKCRILKKLFMLYFLRSV